MAQLVALETQRDQEQEHCPRDENARAWVEQQRVKRAKEEKELERIASAGVEGAEGEQEEERA